MGSLRRSAAVGAIGWRFQPSSAKTLVIACFRGSGSRSSDLGGSSQATTAALWVSPTRVDLGAVDRRWREPAWQVWVFDFREPAGALSPMWRPGSPEPPLDADAAVSGDATGKTTTVTTTAAATRRREGLISRKCTPSPLATHADSPGSGRGRARRMPVGNQARHSRRDALAYTARRPREMAARSRGRLGCCRRDTARGSRETVAASAQAVSPTPRTHPPRRYGLSRGSPAEGAGLAMRSWF